MFKNCWFTLNLFIVGCKLSVFSLCRCICCGVKQKNRPELRILCLGLAKSGKTHLFARLLNEDVTNIQPTKGFIVKDIICDNAILNVTEIGGSEEIMGYWDRYYDYSQGVIYVIDMDCSEADFHLNACQLTRVVSHPLLLNVPVLIIMLRKSDKSSRSVEEVHEALKLDNVAVFSRVILRSHHAEDLSGVRASLDELSAVILQGIQTAVKYYQVDGDGV